MDMQDFYELFKHCNKVTIDSRKIERNDIFFAFSGENFNAAEVAGPAVEHGALAAVVEQMEYADPAQNIFYKESTLKFLQELAAYHRGQLRIPVIGLTGSNGKTTTKELISAVLSRKYNVQCTSGNLNNHIGVPLTLLSIRPQHDIAVIEMGANHKKEIAELCSIAKPDYGYITNFGKAHLEGFGGLEGVIEGKSELYEFLKAHSKIILINENDPVQVSKTLNYSRKITFGTESSDYFFEHITAGNFVGLKYQSMIAESKLTGDYNFTNICAAAAFGLYFKVDFKEIKAAIENYTPTNMRSQIMHKNGKTLVLDTYNANPSSMAASLRNFSAFEGSKTVIIGDMLELGDESDREHAEIIKLAIGLHFDEIITVGPHFSKQNPTGNSFEKTEDLIEFLKFNKLSASKILLKGSRGIALEKIIDFL